MNDLLFFRILAGLPGTAYEDLFVSATKGSNWERLYKEHTDESSFIGYIKGMEVLMSSNDDLTMFHNPHILKSQLGDACRMKVLWTSPQSVSCSFSFQKKSPLLPFFNAIYHQLAETGIKPAFYKRWVKSEKGTCNKNKVSRIDLKKTTLLFLVLGGAIILSILLLVAEIFKWKKQ